MAAVSVKGTHVYLDHSVSMQGYLPKGVVGANNEAVYRQVIERLPENLEDISDGGASHYVLFGGTDERTEADSVAFAQQALARDRYVFKETDIATVLQEIASTPSDHLSVVVTDMFFNDKLTASGGTSQMVQPLQSMIRSGRAVALIGVVTAFEGEVYDVPTETSPREKFSFNGRRPFFLIVVGPTDAVSQYVTLLRNTDLAGMTEKESRLNVALFTRALFKSAGTEVVLGVDADTRAEPLGDSRVAGLQLLEQGIQFPNSPSGSPSADDFVVQARIRAAGESGFNIALPFAAALRDDIVRPADGKVLQSLTSKLWVLTGKRNEGPETCSSAWTPKKAPRLFATAELDSASERLVFEVLADEDRRADLSGPDLYYAEVALVPPLPAPDDLPKWFSEWSFSLREAADIVRAKGRAVEGDASNFKFMPVYQLDRIGRALLTWPVMDESPDPELVRIRIVFEVE